MILDFNYNMNSTVNITASETVKGGHTANPADVTSHDTRPSDSTQPIDLFMLTDHEFIVEVIADTDAHRIYEAYLRFTRDILTLYHGQHSADEIHSALIIAEDHLTILMEDIEDGSEVSVKFVGRAIKFLKQHIQRLAEKCVSAGVAEKQEVVVKESKPATCYTFKFSRPFNQLVELLDSLVNIECFENIRNGEVRESTFIRFMLDLYGFGHKSVRDYRAARNKLYQKAPPPGQGRCKMLPDMLTATEKIWEEKYFGSN